jgi:hypothetical protein
VVKVYKTPAKLFPGLNAPRASVVSDNASVQVKQTRSIPWWMKITALVGGLGGIFILGKMYLGPVWAIVSKIFGR